MRSSEYEDNFFEVEDDFDPDVNHAAFCPTEARPGSEEKVEVLSFRYEVGLPLWHPEDEKVLSNRLVSSDVLDALTADGVGDEGVGQDEDSD